MQTLIAQIESAFETRADINPKTASEDLKQAIHDVLHLLNTGEVRVAQKVNGQWQTNEWVKKAVLLSFRTNDNNVVDGGYTQYYDKVAMKFPAGSSAEIAATGSRFIPGCFIRTGCYLAPNIIVMPSFINIGAYVDSGTMVDTWATVGSCVQVGKNVHISGGVGLGGVLEPLQANPTIIEDNCFIGARSEIVEGVIVEEGSVISMGVYIGQSTRIYNRETGEVSYGRVPKGSVVVPGNLPGKDGKYSLYCAVIVKQVDEKTRGKVSINELLRSVDDGKTVAAN
jgi:2,3,4,5-tetrahydropyridine-2-carboxylate N-succinyltransferase